MSTATLRPSEVDHGALFIAACRFVIVSTVVLLFAGPLLNAYTAVSSWTPNLDWVFAEQRTSQVAHQLDRALTEQYVADDFTAVETLTPTPLGFRELEGFRLPSSMHASVRFVGLTDAGPVYTISVTSGSTTTTLDTATGALSTVG